MKKRRKIIINQKSIDLSLRIQEIKNKSKINNNTEFARKIQKILHDKYNIDRSITTITSWMYNIFNYSNEIIDKIIDSIDIIEKGYKEINKYKNTSEINNVINKIDKFKMKLKGDYFYPKEDKCHV